MEDAKFAISHFIWLLPDGTYFSLDTYGDSHNAVIQPVILNRPNAKKVIDTIQKLECQSSNSTAGLALALNRAIEVKPIRNRPSIDSHTNLKKSSIFT